jgi:pimeloyl-ACP methyl ester carboxylesterase
MRSTTLQPVPVLLVIATLGCGPHAASRDRSAPEPVPTQRDIRADASPRWEPRACWGTVPRGVSARCGYVTVPENRGARNGETRAIRLAAMVLRLEHAAPTQVPTLLLGGGPGSHLIATFVDLFDKYERLRVNGYPAARRFMPLEDMRQFTQVMDRMVADLAKRELVLFDQRGVGYSEPALGCPGDDWDECRRRFAASGIDLAAYNTLENAHDVNDLRVALGYQQVNLHAGSYGTRLALEVLRRYPSTVRAAVLDGVAPPQMRWGEEMAARYDEALDVLFSHCEADGRCRAAYPGLKASFYETVERLNASPARVGIAGRTATLDGDDLRDMVWNALFDTQKARWLPALIWRAGRGDTTLWGETIAANISDHAGDRMSWGMHYSVECSGAWAFETPGQLAGAARPLNPAIRDGVVRTLARPFDVCSQWQVPALPSVREPVRSDVPALLLSGELDPGTPPAFAEMAARTLSRSYRYVLPFLGHTDGFTSACHASIVSAFLDDPTHAPPTACIPAMERAAWFAVE